MLCRPGRDATQGRFSPCMPAKEGTKRVLRGGQYSSTNHSSTNLLGRHLYRSPTYWKGAIYSLPPNITPPSHHSRFRGHLLVGPNCHCTVAVEKNASQWRLDHAKPPAPPPHPCPPLQGSHLFNTLIMFLWMESNPEKIAQKRKTPERKRQRENMKSQRRISNTWSHFRGRFSEIM